ncbi:MAG TPA: Lrp/AsnC ligand binding domain-containing protein [Bacteroidales bacterium]|nr:Lrp/AsnC ligand binding domain-containing protein [Bacteroidales bacterium]
MENFQIDTLDRKILSIIKKNARTPFLEVGRACEVSGAAVHQRVQRLIKEGVITGAEFILDPQKVGYHTCAFIGIFLEKASMFKEVVNKLEQIPEIVECHYTTGNWSIFIKIFAQNNDHLKRILTDNLQAIQGISRTETFISLEESFRRQLPV